MHIKLFSKKQDALNYIAENPTFILTSYNIKDKSYNFIVCSSKDAYYNLINKIVVNELIEKDNEPPQLKPFNTHINNIFEVILTDTPKLYIDLDFNKTAPITISEFDELIKTLLTNLTTLLNIDCNSDLLDHLIYIRDEQADKLIKSSHIIFNKIRMHKDQQRNLVSQLKTANILQALDTAIYSRDRNFCLPNHTKITYNNKRFFIPYNKFTQENNKIELFLLCNIDNTKLYTYTAEEAKIVNTKYIETNAHLIKNIHATHDNLIDLLIEHIPSEFYTSNAYMFNSLVKYLINNKYDIYKFLNYSKTQEHKEYSTDAIEHYINGINDAHYYYKNILLYIAKQYNLKFITKSTLTDQFINYVNTITNAELKQQLLAFDDIAREASEWKKDRFIYNYKHYKINIREHTIADINKNTFYYEPQDSTNINSTYKNECNSTITNIETLKNHIKTTKTKTKLIFVKALYGSGKTKEIINTALDKFLTQSPNNKVLFITENNTLNSEITAKLKNTFKEFNINIRHHQEFKDFSKKKQDADFIEEFNNITIYICSLESIKKRTLTNIKYDLIILDEYTSILNHFKSPTMQDKNKQNTFKAPNPLLIDNEYTKFKKFKSLLVDATEIIALDADLTSENTAFLENMLNVKADKFYCNDNRFNDYTIYNYYNGNHLLNKLNEALTQDKKIALCSTSRKQLNGIYTAQRGTDKTILLLDRDGVKLYKNQYEQTIDKEEFLKHIEHYIVVNQVELFLYSPTITTGVSIETAYFNMLFAFCFNRQSPTARAFSQMLFRNRNLIDKTIYISYIYGLFFNPNINKNTIDETYNITNNYNILFNASHPTEKHDINYRKLDILNLTEQKYSEVAYTQELLTILKQHNLKVVNIFSNVSYFKDGTPIEDAKILNTNEDYDAIGRAYNITKATADEYLKKQETANITIDEKYELQRHFLIETNDPIKTELINNLTQINYTDNSEIVERKICNIRGLENTKNLFKRQKAYYYYDYESHINFLTEIVKEQTKKKYTDALTIHDRELNADKIKHSILIMLGLNRNNNFSISYKNEEFEKHINKHKETIINNFDIYISILNFKPLYFKTSKNLTKTIIQLLEEFRLFKIYYTSKKHSKKSLEQNPIYKYDKDTIINIELDKNIYGFYNPYKYITTKDNTKLIHLHSNYFEAYSIINTIYDETTFNNKDAKKDLYITNSNKYNHNADIAKKLGVERKRLKQYENEILTEHKLVKYEPIITPYLKHKLTINYYQDNSGNRITATSITNEPINLQVYKLKIVFRKAENGTLKTFTNIYAETIYNKQEPKIYYTTATTKIINTNANINANINKVNAYINSIEGVFITRKTDINKVYQEKQTINKYGFCNDKIRLNNNFDYAPLTTRIKYNNKFLKHIFNKVVKQTRYRRFDRLKNNIENAIYSIYHNDLESDDEYI